MRNLQWKYLLVVILIGLSIWQLSYSYRYFRLTEEDKSYFDPLQLKKLSSRALHLGLDLRGGMHIVLEIDKSKLKPEEQTGAIDRALEIIRNRIDKFGVSEPIIQKQGTDKILIQLPGVINKERAEEIIGKTALLEFKLVADPEILKNTLSVIDEYLKKTYGDTMTLSGYFVSEMQGIEENYRTNVERLLNDQKVKELIPYGYEFLWGEKILMQGYSLYPLYLVKAEPLLTGDAILDAIPGLGTPGNPYAPRVELTMTREARGKWAMITGANIGKRIAIVLDGVVQSAPVVKERIPSGQSLIEMGGSTLEDAKTLAIILKAGALPAPLNIVEERVVGPSLGIDSIRQGSFSFIIAALIVFIFMIIYYFIPGIIADFGLILNVLFLLAMLSAFRATLTLPGIAGIVLTIGMAVDANVLIYERLREELSAGKTLRTSIAAAYSRVFITIFDANVTTIFTALILYWFGTGPIRGFAITLSLGLVASFFTALFVSRMILDTVSLGRIKSIKMLIVFRNPNINFIKIRKIAYYLSLALILISIGSVIAHKGFRYGVDFTGGYIFEVSFEKPVSIGELRATLGKLGLGESNIQKYSGTNIFLVRTKETDPKVMENIKKVISESFKDNKIEYPREELVGPSTSAGLRLRTLWVVILSMVGILLYVSIRFTFRIGTASVLALIHDLIITLGFLSITNKEITISVIAAILTILGYSINDSIIVSDRIRENVKLLRKDNYDTIINRSLNETLGRTIITALTTLFVVVVLFFFGGRVIHDFAFTLLVGIISGTYSSIFVVATLVSDWERKFPSRRLK